MKEAAQNKTSLASLKQRLNEAAKVMAKKGDYAFSKYRNGEVDVTYKGKVIATGDFDSGADAWFMDIKGVKGQKSFNSPGDAIKFFMKSKLTEVDEDAPVNATGDSVDMSPGKRMTKPLKRFKEHLEALQEGLPKGAIAGFDGGDDYGDIVIYKDGSGFYADGEESDFKVKNMKELKQKLKSIGINPSKPYFGKL